MTKQITQKYNDACIKLFEFLKMLYEGDVDFKKVIDHFSEGNYDGTSNTHVTLNKYLNALKIFGINIKKSNHKYTLKSPVYKMNFTIEDIKSIYLLKRASESLPEGKTKELLDAFIRDLTIRFDDASQNTISVLKNTHTMDMEFSNAEMVEQVKLCKKYCQDELKLEVIYTDENGKTVNLLCSPKDVAYIKRKICLLAVGSNGSRVYQIPVESIQSLKQTNSKVSDMTVPITIVYRIKNRLARNYKMRDWETLQTLEAGGNKVITNKGEDLNVLLARLMKYGKECEVVSPKFFKEEMLNRINKTLSNYQ